MEIKIKVADYKARWWKYYLQNKYSNKKNLESNIKLLILQTVADEAEKELKRLDKKII